jgi:outer membrane protein assembly factor BamB
MLQITDLLFSGTGGNVVCLNRHTGQEIWKTAIGGHGFVTLLTDQTMIYAQCAGKLSALRYSDGAILWQNDLPGCGFGIGALAFAGGQQNGPPPLVAAAAATAAAEEEATRRRSQ